MTSENTTVQPTKKRSKLKIFLIVLLVLILALIGGGLFASVKVKDILSEQLTLNNVQHESIEINYMTLSIAIYGIGYTLDNGITKLDAKVDRLSLNRVNPFSYLSDADFPILFHSLLVEGADIKYDFGSSMQGFSHLDTTILFDKFAIYGWHQNPKKLVEAMQFGTMSQEFLERAFTFQIEEVELAKLDTTTSFNNNEKILFDLGEFTTAWNGINTNLLLDKIALVLNVEKTTFPLAPLAFSLAEFDAREIALPSPAQMVIIVRHTMNPEDANLLAQMQNLDYFPVGQGGLKLFMNNAILDMMNKNMLNLDTMVAIADIANYTLTADIKGMNFQPELLAFINPFLSTSIINLGLSSGVDSELFLDAIIPDFGKTVEATVDIGLNGLFKARISTEIEMQEALSANLTKNYPSVIHLFNLKYEDTGLIPRLNIYTQKKLNLSYQRAKDNMILATRVLQFIRPDLGNDIEKIILEPGKLEVTLTKPSSLSQMLTAPQDIPIITTYTSTGLNLEEEVNKIQAN